MVRFLAVLVVSLSSLAADHCPVRFRITLPPAAAGPVSGRMLVFMTSEAGKRDTLGVSWFGHSTWVAGAEYESISPGQTVEFDADTEAWPKAFSQAEPGTYQFMALLDRDHDYNYYGQDADDLYSPVVTFANVPGSEIALVLSRKEAEPKAPEREGIEPVEYESPLLSRFWGRPVRMRANVVLPPSYATETHRQYPAVYIHHGYTDDSTSAYRMGPGLRRLMKDGKGAEAVLVFLNGACPQGDHEFADSANNGPWGRALVEEFIPHLEHRYRLIGNPAARFLTGHSSGGWASLWNLITNPEFFAGAWSTAPDPVDFRSFTGFDAAPGTRDNAYFRADGKPHYLARSNGRDLITIEDFARREQVIGPYGGQFESFEWVFSPKGEDGRPLKLFNRVTGALDPAAVRAWQKYDIRALLAANWEQLGPKLRGKLNIIVGAEDTFHLEEPVEMLCDFLKQKGSDAVCEVVPGRDHMNLYDPYKTYPHGLEERILREMTAKLEASKQSGVPGLQ